jgi:pimeloyl-ACP methyl ester carboxylesterase
VIREERFDTGTVEINYGEGPPNGPPFVILHGGAGSWRYADQFIDLLAPDWHVFAPDFRGHGQSGRVPGRYTVRDYSDDIVSFLFGAVREPAVVYGHSLGGRVGVMVAARSPELVCAFINGDVPFFKHHRPVTDPNIHQAQNELWHRLCGRPVDEIEAALRDMRVRGADGNPVRAEDLFGQDSPWFAFHALNLHRLDPDMLATVLAGDDVMLDGYDPDALLPAIPCPVLLLQADTTAGGFFSDEEVELGLRLLPDARVVTLKGIDHSLHARHAQEILDAITPFLADVAQIGSQVRNA